MQYLIKILNKKKTASISCPRSQQHNSGHYHNFKHYNSHTHHDNEQNNNYHNSDATYAHCNTYITYSRRAGALWAGIQI